MNYPDPIIYAIGQIVCITLVGLAVILAVVVWWRAFDELLKLFKVNRLFVAWIFDYYAKKRKGSR
jgi:hypothetical protein